MSNIIFEKKVKEGVFKVFDDYPKEIPFFQVNQVHGKDILINKTDQEADGMIISSDFKPTPLAIKTADCIPLLIIGEKGYGMVHAGWRGLKSQIHLQDPIVSLNPQYFFLGPHISVHCFEVTEEFFDHFPQSNDCFSKKNDKITFDLGKKMQQELKESFPQAIIESSNQCTYSQSEYNSYRRDKTSLRNWNIYFPSLP